MNQDMNHLSIEELTDYFERRLSGADMQRVESHLSSGCPTCQEEWDWLKDTLSLMVSDDWIDPPDEMVMAVQAAARHYSMAELTDYLEGLAPEAQLLKRHLASCPTCQEDLHWLEETLSLMVSDNWIDPPDEIVVAVQTAARRYSYTEEQKKKSKGEGAFSVLLERLRVFFMPRPAWGAVAALLVLLVVIGGLPLVTMRSASVQNDLEEIAFVVTQTRTLSMDMKVAPNQAKPMPTAPPLAPTMALAPTALKTLPMLESGALRTLEGFEGVVTLLEDNTELSFEGPDSAESFPEERINLFQSLGKALFHPSGEHSLRINTPACLIMGQDAEFTVAVSENGLTEVVISEGEVSVTAQEVTITATSGQTVTVEPEQPPTISP